MDRGAWQAIIHGVVRESDITLQLSNNFSLLTIKITLMHYMYIKQNCPWKISHQLIEEKITQ